MLIILLKLTELTGLEDLKDVLITLGMLRPISLKAFWFESLDGQWMACYPASGWFANTSPSSAKGKVKRWKHLAPLS